MDKIAKVNLHTHERTASGDSGTPAEVMAQEYADQGFDMVGFVGHDSRPEIDTDDLPIMAVTGIEHEVETEPRRVHLLDFPEYDFLALAHPKMSHPESPHTGAIMDSTGYGTNAIEAYNRGKSQGIATEAMEYPTIASDDAHSTFHVGGSFMEVPVDRMTPEAVFEAVLDGKATLRNPGLSRREYYTGRLHQGLALLGERYGGSHS